MIHYSVSFRKFLKNSNSRIAKILYNCDVTQHPAYSLMLTNENIDYITFRNDGTISFLPAGKEHKVNEDGEWARDGRQSGRPGKVIQKLFTEKALKIIPIKEFESFSNDYKAEYNASSYTFTLLDNKDIPGVYSMNIKSGGGSLNNSCMNGNPEYMGIYKHCKQAKILILTTKDDLLCGRALVWEISEKVTLMDRIYVTDDFMYDMFLKYAENNKWLRKKEYKSYADKTTFIDHEGNELNKHITISTDVDHEYYPYIDTFSYGDDTSINNYENGPYQYDCTDGDRSGSHQNEIYDDLDERWIHEDYAVRITGGERRGCWTHDENAVTLNGRIYWIQDSCVIEIGGLHYHVDDTVFSEFHGEYFLIEDCVYSDEEESYILLCEAREIDGKWYHENNLPETHEEDTDTTEA